MDVSVPILRSDLTCVVLDQLNGFDYVEQWDGEPAVVTSPWLCSSMLGGGLLNLAMISRLVIFHCVLDDPNLPEIVMRQFPNLDDIWVQRSIEKPSEMRSWSTLPVDLRFALSTRLTDTNDIRIAGISGFPISILYHSLRVSVLQMEAVTFAETDHDIRFLQVPRSSSVGKCPIIDIRAYLPKTEDYIFMASRLLKNSLLSPFDLSSVECLGLGETEESRLPVPFFPKFFEYYGTVVQELFLRPSKEAYEHPFIDLSPTLALSKLNFIVFQGMDKQNKYHNPVPYIVQALKYPTSQNGPVLDTLCIQLFIGPMSSVYSWEPFLVALNELKMRFGDWCGIEKPVIIEIRTQPEEQIQDDSKRNNFMKQVYDAQYKRLCADLEPLMDDDRLEIIDEGIGSFDIC